jgi:cytochrome c biogenesis protein ResB
MHPNSDTFMAVSSNSLNFTLDDVFDRMVREGSSITKAEALAVFEEISQHVIKIVKEGNSVTTPLVNISSSVKGTFDNREEHFNSNKHRVRITIAAGKRLAKATSEINPQKTRSKKRQPDITYFKDIESETTNKTITPNSPARITGSLLKFDEDDPDQGIFFIDADNGQEIKVDSPIKNMPSELIFMNPDLPTGSYRVQIRSIVYNTSEIRSGTLNDSLRVE